MTTLAIIPARGGSKGLRRKNLQRVGGRPLVARTIVAASRCPSVDAVVVSTDDDQIAEVARSSGAEVIRRPRELASDTATTESALLHALDVAPGQLGLEADHLVLLQCTSPFTAPSDIDGVLGPVRRGTADSALCVMPFHGFLWRHSGSTATAVNHDWRQRPRRQDRDTELLETGSAYAMNVAGFREAKHRFFGRIALHVVPRDRGMEIDDADDLRACRRLAAVVAGRDELVELIPTPLHAVVFDFDGVMTDDRVLVADDGREAVTCHRGDGMGIELLREAGVTMLVISKESNPVVSARCAKLGVPCLQSTSDKLSALRPWLAERGLDPEHVIHLGNDRNDVECMRAVGLAVAVQDAHPSALEAADVVLARRGGQGAVRELADAILERKQP